MRREKRTTENADPDLDADGGLYALLELKADETIDDIADKGGWHLEKMSMTEAVLVADQPAYEHSYKFRISTATPLTIERYDSAPENAMVAAEWVGSDSNPGSDLDLVLVSQ